MQGNWTFTYGTLEIYIFYPEVWIFSWNFPGWSREIMPTFYDIRNSVQHASHASYFILGPFLNFWIFVVHRGIKPTSTKPDRCSEAKTAGGVSKNAEGHETTAVQRWCQTTHEKTAPGPALIRFWLEQYCSGSHLSQNESGRESHIREEQKQSVIYFL